jgi:tetratricopeptide (TPR) repeat protein
VTYSRQNKLARAQILQQQHRHGDAVNELRQHLGAEPHDAVAHAMLAVSLLETKQPKDATAAAQQAVGLSPDLPYAHYALAYVLYKRNWLDEARDAAAEAIRLESFNPNHFALLSAIEMERRNWPAALEHAGGALQIDPDHDWAINLRAMALVKLGRRDEASRTMSGALSRDPENAYSHANQGWTLLHRGDHRQARVHFREALRLDPTLDWARQGMVESLKSGFPPYKLLLLFWLWMARISHKAQWGVILGAWLGYQVIKNVARQNPAAAIYLWPIMIAYVAFVLMTWLAYPLLNLMLRLHPDGRYALSRQQVMQSNIIGILLAIFFTSLGLFVATTAVGFLTLMFVSGLLVFPVAALFGAPAGWPRHLMLAVTIGLGLVGIAAVALVFATGEDGGRAFGGLFAIFILGVILSQIAANALPMFRPKQ